jgi:hypothetical protein
MRDTKERLSLLWLFALLNYLYADVLALFAVIKFKGSESFILRPFIQINRPDSGG